MPCPPTRPPPPPLNTFPFGPGDRRTTREACWVRCPPKPAPTTSKLPPLFPLLPLLRPGSNPPNSKSRGFCSVAPPRPPHSLPMPSAEAATPPSGAPIAWNWVIEELADCKEFDSSIFGALMKWNRSTVTDPVYGGRTMERPLLKYLEELAESTEFPPSLPSLAPAAATPVPWSEEVDRRINAASSSESILCHLSQEVGGLNSTGNCINESCRNVLRQVILQKKAALHKSSLDLLKDVILEDCRKGDSSSNIFSCLVGGDKRNSWHTDSADDHQIASRKLKLDNHIQVKLLSAMSSESNQNLLLKEPTYRHENLLHKQNVHIGLGDNNARSTEEIIAQKFPVEMNKMPQSSSPTKIGSNIQLQAVSSDGGQRVLSDSSSDDECYYDVAPDFQPNEEIIAAEMLKFQNPVSNDSQGGDWMQQRSCIKCGEGGQILSCTGTGCPIAVHESCLGSSVHTENPEDFKCPFCSYLLAASAYYEARKKVSFARKTLSSFMDRGRMGGKKVALPTWVEESSRARKSSKGNHRDKACVNQRGEITEEPERQNQAQAAIDGEHGNLPCGQGHTLIDKNDGAAPSGETGMVNEYHVVDESQNEEQAAAANISDDYAQLKVTLHKGKGYTDNCCHSTRMTRHCPPGECKNALVDKLCHTDAGASQIMETDRGCPSDKPVDVSNSLEHAQGLKHQQQVVTDFDTISLPCQEIRVECEKVRKQDPAIDHDVDQENSSKNHSGEHSSSNKGRKQKISARHSKRYTNPLYPYTRRNRLPWTSEEEAMLKEAMEKFYPSGETSISWIKIWDYGKYIFHKTRQPADLKDKWRNIRRKEGEIWKRESNRTNGES